MRGRWSRRTQFIEAEFPSRPWLSKSEAMNLLRRGPELHWFRPWAEHAHVAPITRRPWGYIHVHGEWDEPPVWEVVGYHSPEALAWGLQALFNRGGHEWHRREVDGIFNDHECHGVFYWLPSDPRLLHLKLGVNR